MAVRLTDYNPLQPPKTIFQTTRDNLGKNLMDVANINVPVDCVLRLKVLSALGYVAGGDGE